jgi:hypothetical protein
MLKKIKSLFIIEEEDKQQKTVTVPPKEKVKSNVIQNKLPPTVDESSPFVDVLLGAIDRHNLEGFDYLEFKRSLQSLSDLSQDEATRFKSAFAVMQTMGISKEKLLQTAQHYLGVLKQEEQKFEQALIQQKERQVTSKVKQAEAIEQTIYQKVQQIKQLTAEVEANQAQIAQLKIELDEANQKIVHTKNEFTAAHYALVTQIEADMQKIKQYLS